MHPSSRTSPPALRATVQTVHHHPHHLEVDMAAAPPGTINPGTRPVPDATEAAAVANIAVFAAAVSASGGHVDGEPIRDLSLDTGDGRFGFRLPIAGGGAVLIRMPGTELAHVRDDMSAQAFCLYINEVPWWWPSAVQAARGWS
jgi:hypothetical protein